jgi:acyl carrier protein
MKAKITAILSEIRPEFDFTKDVNFIEEGMLDSFDVVSLVSSLDETFGISINILPDNFSSIENIIALLKKNGVE